MLHGGSSPLGVFRFRHDSSKACETDDSRSNRHGWLRQGEGLAEEQEDKGNGDGRGHWSRTGAQGGRRVGVDELKCISQQPFAISRSRRASACHSLQSAFRQSTVAASHGRHLSHHRLASARTSAPLSPLSLTPFRSAQDGQQGQYYAELDHRACADYRVRLAVPASLNPHLVTVCAAPPRPY